MSEEKKPLGRGRKPKNQIEEVAVMEAPVAKVHEVFNPLQNRRVYVRPIKRRDAWLDEKHEANFLYKDAYFELAAPIDSITGNIEQPLSSKELQFFENIELSHIHGLNYRKGDLSTNRKEDNVWWTFSGEYSVKLKNETRILNLANAKEYIIYKMLLANKDLIAPNGDVGEPGAQGHKLTFKFKIEEEDFEDNQKASAADKRKLAYKYFGKIEENRNELLTVLSLADPSKTPKYETNMNTLISGVDSLITTNIDKFIEIVEHEHFKMKAFIYSCIKLGFIVMESNKIYTAGGDNLLGRNMTEAATFLADVENQGVYIEINDKIKALK